jgi:HTH-type transcriptional regulator/antitoxin HigA
MEGIDMAVLNHDLAETVKVWPVVSRVLSTLRTKKQYNRAAQLLDELIDEASAQYNPLIESLIDTLGTLIKDYEDRKIPEPEGDAIGCLKFLMREHNLKQSDLKELGSQGVVSEILSGKRQLNVRQIKTLSQRFKVSPAVFI